MSRDRPRPLGPTCPTCGRPWPPGRRRCGRCGHDPAAPAQVPGGLLTVFGYGVCGFMAGAEVGLAWAVATHAGPGLHRAAVLAVAGLGVIGLTLAAQVGRRLALGVRCAYEHLLLALDLAGLVLVAAALAGAQRWETLALVGMVSGGLALGLLRRYGYGIRP